MAHIFANISTIAGDSAVSSYDGTIACDAVQFGIDLPVLQSGSARTQGSSIRTGLILTHRLDKASPKLRKAACSGNAIGDVVITVTKLDDGTYTEQEVITLNGTNTVDGCWLNTKPRTDGSGLTDTFFESFAIEYTKLKWEYKVGGANVSESFDASGGSDG